MLLILGQIIVSEDTGVAWYMSSDFLNALYSGDGMLIRLLVLLMVLDVITGLSKAVVNKNLWSRKSLFGVARKIMVFVIIITSNIVDLILNMSGLLVYGVVLFYIANECLSILENSATLGLPLPDKLLEALEVIKDKENVEDKITKFKGEDDGKN